MAATDPSGEPLRSVHTTSLVDFLSQAGCSVLISTYQAGKLIAVRADGNKANTHFRNFDTPMGLAYSRGRLVVGTKHHVWEFHNQPVVAQQLDTIDKCDACFMPRQALVTGQIAIHDLAWIGDEVWGVNTRFSCLCTFDRNFSFVPRWRPKFVSALAPEDRCHLNGMGIRDGRPRYVTALGETDASSDWRANKANGGCLIDLESNELICRGLSMPHSPRWYDGKLWVLESGVGSLSVVDPSNGKLTTVALLPGFTRGLDFVGPFALLGLSQVRETALFSGIPITDRLSVEERMCGMWVVDTRSGEIVAFLRFEAGVQEIFAIQVLPGIRRPELLTDYEAAVANAFILPDDALGDVPDDHRRA